MANRPSPRPRTVQCWHNHVRTTTTLNTDNGRGTAGSGRNNSTHRRAAELQAQPKQTVANIIRAQRLGGSGNIRTVPNVRTQRHPSSIQGRGRAVPAQRGSKRLQRTPHQYT